MNAMLAALVMLLTAAPGEPVWDSARLRQVAMDEVVRAGTSQNPFVRANAIEVAGAMPDRLVPMVQRGLEDPSPVVRFAAATQVAQHRLKDMAEAVRPLQQDPSPHVRAAALVALSRTGEKVDLSPLAGYLTHEDPGVRANAAMLMGLTGNKSAIYLLEDLAATPLPLSVSTVRATIVRLQFAEARVKLGDREALDAVRAAMFSTFGEVRVFATQLIGKLGDAQMQEAMFNNLNGDPVPIDMRLASIESISRTGLAPDIRELLTRRETLDEALAADLPAVRAQAAFTAGALEAARARYRPGISSSEPLPVVQAFDSEYLRGMLQALLQDPDESVRIAAAKGVLEP